MSFFYVCDTVIAKNNNKAIPLKVIQNNGINVSPDIDINVTRLLSNKTDRTFKNFYNRGYGGVTFTINVLIRKGESQDSANLENRRIDRAFTKKDKYYSNKDNVLNWLDYWIKNMTPLYVVTDAIDIKNGLYIITDNSNRVQTFKNYTVWSLEFTSFTGLNSVKFTNSNKAIKKVIKKYKKSIKDKKKQTLKSKSANKSKLKKCKISQLKYSKKKNNVKCVKYMQQVLYKNYGLLKKSQVDGWFGNKTKNALKKFQKKKKLKQTGKVNKATFKALYS